MYRISSPSQPFRSHLPSSSVLRAHIATLLSQDCAPGHTLPSCTMECRVVYYSDSKWKRRRALVHNCIINHRQGLRYFCSNCRVCCAGLDLHLREAFLSDYRKLRPISSLCVRTLRPYWRKFQQQCKMGYDQQPYLLYGCDDVDVGCYREAHTGLLFHADAVSLRRSYYFADTELNRFVQPLCSCPAPRPSQIAPE